MYTKVSQFFREVRSELRKVTFPSRKETLASTAVVIVVVFIVAAYLGLVDIGLSLVIPRILR
jgi:preprotein translocase subunit SecE